jgi:hypothetical protein
MEAGKPSENFLLWTRKTAHISDDGFKRGFDMLEYRLKEAGRNGTEAWPPSYAEFIGYCEPPIGSKMYSKNLTTLDTQYDASGNLVAMIEKPKESQPESEHDKLKRLKAGRESINGLLSMFEDDTPANKPEPNAVIEPCTNCQTGFEAILTTCPRCGEKR